MSEKCEVCGEPSELKCSACKLVSYCGKEHQKQGWKTHKTLCRPFEVQHDSIIGNCLVATRDIKPGDTILSEYPIVYGPRPHMVEEGPVPCPGCCKLIIGEKSVRCEGCDFPICHQNCPGLKDMEKHGHECMILGLRDVKAINGLHEFYRQDALLVLRCLLLQNRHPKKFAQLLEMNGHMEKRGPNSDIYRSSCSHYRSCEDIDERIVDYLHNNFFHPMTILEGRSGQKVLKDISKETVHKICGIIDVNALEINQEAEVTALYPTVYLLEHNCLPNTTHMFDNDGYKLTLKATLPIKAGEHITTMYTHCLWGTQARREHLRETKYFDCQCNRCSDPTELGSYLSALKCIGTNDEPCGGTQLPVDPIDDKTEWTCDKCTSTLSNEEVCFLVNGIGEEVDNVQLANPTVRELEALLNKMLTFLHPNHYHIYAVKHSLIQLYGYQQGYTPTQITDDCLIRKAAMCRELLDITNKIDPGNSRLSLYHAVLLHELFLANWITVKRKWDLGIKAKVKSVLNILNENKECLTKLQEVLKNEKNTPAGDKLINLVDNSTREFHNFLERNKIDLRVQSKEKVANGTG